MILAFSIKRFVIFVGLLEFFKADAEEKKSARIRGRFSEHRESIDQGKRHLLTGYDGTWYNGHYYAAVDAAALTWNEAVLDLGGTPSGCGKTAHLATLTDLSENDFVTNYFDLAGSGEGMWIGLNDQLVEGNFQWEGTTEAFSFSNFLDSGEPAAVGDCASIRGNGDLGTPGGWKMEDCDTTARKWLIEYDCDFETAPTLETAGGWILGPGSPLFSPDFTATSTADMTFRWTGPVPDVSSTGQGIGIDPLDRIGVDVRGFQYDCTTAPMRSDVLFDSAYYDHGTGELVATFNIDKTNFLGNTVEFCLELQYLWEDIETTHLFTKISFELDFAEGFVSGASSIQLVTLTDLEDRGQDIATNYLGDAYLCPNSCAEEDYPGPLPQGSSVSYCVATNTPGTYVESCSSIDIFQAQYANGSPGFGPLLDAADTDLFTSGECNEECCRYTTILDQRWFAAPGSVDPDDKPGDLSVTGTCNVGFGTFPSRSRNLEETESKSRPLQIHSQSFGGLTIPMENVQVGNSGGESIGVSSLVLGTGLALAAML